MPIKAKRLQQTNVLDAVTIDGYKIRLSADITSFDELDTLNNLRYDGIGLFRTEYLLTRISHTFSGNSHTLSPDLHRQDSEAVLTQHCPRYPDDESQVTERGLASKKCEKYGLIARNFFPSEDEQFLDYRTLVEKAAGYPAVIRTFATEFDTLGDVEKNPCLGCRSIRLMFKEPEIFKTQMRAILRASVFGELRILFPMISGVSELRQAKAIVEDAKKELLDKGMPFSPHIPIGCMIEVPSAAITSDILLQESDFLSIGINDLIQYLLAVDRNNQAMSYLYVPTHPSVIRMIKTVVDESVRFRKPISVCGDSAANPHFAVLLLGLGVHELVVPPSSLSIIKNVISQISIVEAKDIALRALSCIASSEVEFILTEAYRNIHSDIST